MDPYNIFNKKVQQIKFLDVRSQPQVRASRLKFIQSPAQSLPQGIRLSKESQYFLLPSFVMLIVGSMGSGKTHFISSLISNPLLLGYRFQRILYMGTAKYNGCILKQQNYSPSFDTKWLYQKIQQANKWNCQNMLVIIDDLITQFKGQSWTQLQKLVYNRRHIMTQLKSKKGNISFVITSQKFTNIPRGLRDTCNLLVLFRVNGQQLNTLLRQCNPLKSNFKARTVIQKLQQNKFIFININTSKIFYDQYFQQL